MPDLIPDLMTPSMINSEFPQLKESCYLDHTGSALYAKSQVESIAKDLIENLYSNPHSNSLPSKFCGDSVDQVRYRLLEYFNTTTDDYTVIYTSGATEALKIVAETFDFAGKCFNESGVKGSGELVYLQENHTSVLGMRNVANIVQNNVTTRSVPQSEAFQLFSQPLQIRITSKSTIFTHNSLFVYPGQSNFSGLKYPLTWIEKAQNGMIDSKMDDRSIRWYCLLDAATLVSTGPLDLSKVRPDFVTISFYKMFGLPTGLGALLVRNSSSSVLHKAYYGGGTVQMALSSKNLFVHRPVLHERFEDGTINFLSIVSLRHGLEWYRRVGLSPDVVSLHCFRLSRYTHDRLRHLHHANGEPAVCIYADTLYDNPLTQGGIVNFNIYRDTGQCVGSMEVLTLANLHNIHLRTGCFCNPGACQRHLAISDQQYYSNFQAGHVCGDDKDLIEGKPTGSVRVSFGPYSRQRDADRLLDMLTECFVTKPPIYKIEFHGDRLPPDDDEALEFKTAVVSSEAFHFIGCMWIYKEPANWQITVELYKRQFKSNKDSIEEAGKKNADYIRPIPDSLLHNGCCRNNQHNQLLANTKDIGEQDSPEVLRVSQVCLYPVKSCGAQKVDSWPLDERGLRYDRCWMVVTDSGVALTQKQEPRLCLIRPIVDLQCSVLCLTYADEESCSIPISMCDEEEKEGWMCHSKVCGDSVRGLDCGQRVADWLSSILHRPGLRLLRQSESILRAGKNSDSDGIPPSLTLSNQAQFLLINKNSVQWLTEKLPPNSDCQNESMVDRFRSNFVFKGNCPAFAEQDWKEVTIGSVNFKVNGPCGRCQMICIDQSTGNRTKEPLTTLAANCQSRLKFGIYLSQRKTSDNAYINVGDILIPALS